MHAGSREDIKKELSSLSNDIGKKETNDLVHKVDEPHSQGHKTRSVFNYLLTFKIFLRKLILILIHII